MKIAITLEADQWNQMLGTLQDMPFRAIDPIAPILREIQRQGTEQAKAAEISTQLPMQQ